MELRPGTGLHNAPGVIDTPLTDSLLIDSILTIWYAEAMTRPALARDGVPTRPTTSANSTNTAGGEL